MPRPKNEGLTPAKTPGDTKTETFCLPFYRLTTLYFWPLSGSTASHSTNAEQYLVASVLRTLPLANGR